MAREIAYVVCPFCGHKRPQERTVRAESHPIARFDEEDPESFDLVVYQVGGGKMQPEEQLAVYGKLAKGRGRAPAKGFETVSTISLEEVLSNPEGPHYHYIEELRDQCERLLEFIRAHVEAPK